MNDEALKLISIQNCPKLSTVFFISLRKRDISPQSDSSVLWLRKYIAFIIVLKVNC